MKIRKLTLLGLLTAVVLLMCTTPLGTLPVGPLSITLNMIPIAIAAVALGPTGGLIIGSVFGLYSFLQAMGIGVPSALGILTFGINPFLTFVQRFVSRALVGYLLGVIYRLLRKIGKIYLSLIATGILAALLNFIFFMGLLILCFGNNPGFREFLKLDETNTVLIYLATTFASNTIFEIIATTVITTAICLALYRARLLTEETQK